MIHAISNISAVYSAQLEKRQAAASSGPSPQAVDSVHISPEAHAALASGKPDTISARQIAEQH